VILDPRTGASVSTSPAAISVGTNPTFQGTRRTVEAHLLDFDGDLYGEHVGVEFVQRLRPMAAFTGVEDLVAAMDRDVAETREITSSAYRPAPRPGVVADPG
jgi:riboflavin kinase/FMN adenylyltransferase